MVTDNSSLPQFPYLRDFIGSVRRTEITKVKLLLESTPNYLSVRQKLLLSGYVQLATFVNIRPSPSLPLIPITARSPE